jgi:S1-C subfamily serine protease
VLAGVLLGAGLTTVAVALVSSGGTAPGPGGEAGPATTTTGGSAPATGYPVTTTALTRTAVIGPLLAGTAESAAAAVMRLVADRGSSTVTGGAIVIGAGGVLLTTYDLVNGAEAVSVVTLGGTREVATVVGADQATDVAVLRIPMSGLPTLVTGPVPDSRDVVTAVVPSDGDPWRAGLGMGEVVATDIDAGTVGDGMLLDQLASDLQLPAEAEGSPVLDSRGRVVGMIARPGHAGVATLCIPMARAERAATTLLAQGSVSHGWLGVESVALSPAGVVVAGVASGSPAQRAGLQAGDVVVSVDGRPVRSASDLLAGIMLRSPGADVVLRLARLGRSWDVRVVLGQSPGD